MIYKKPDENISNTQMGFIKGLGTKDFLLTINIVAQDTLT